MAEKEFNTRIVHKHDIQANWEKAVGFIPKQGELIVYDIDENYDYQRIKIGDGVTNVNVLPFWDKGIEDKLIENAPNLEADRGEPGYIANRPGYRTINKDVNTTIEVVEVGSYCLLDFSTVNEDFVNNYLTYEELIRDYSRLYDFYYSYDRVVVETGSVRLTSLERVGDKIKLLDDINCYTSIGRSALFYIIHNRDLLSEELKEKIPYNGIWLISTESINPQGSQMRNFWFREYRYTKFDPNLIPDNVMFKRDMGEYVTQEEIDGAIADLHAVQYTEQTLTDEQKQQARENIGAADKNTFVQSVADWNQNDETALDYIKNRTHYDNIVTTSVVLADEEVYLELLPDFFPEGYWSEPITLENGKTYTVTVNDVDSGIVCKQELVCENDELIFDSPEELQNTLTIKSEVIYGDNGGTYHIKIEITEFSGTLKQLDEKFIPDTIARVDDIPTTAIKPFPYYEVIELSPGLITQYKVNLEELEPNTPYSVQESASTPHTAFALCIICDDGTEKIVTNISVKYRIYYVIANNKIITLYDDENTVYSINISDKSTSSNVVVKSNIISRWLPVSNSVAYTPTDNYHPATKKYVDDAVNGFEKFVPDTLPNPNALTFTGAVNATYDGSEPVSVEIPAGGAVIASESAPENTSVLWIDTSDDEADNLQAVIDTALAQAKASGEFDGDDYVLTPADKQEIAGMVEVPEGGIVTDEQIASAVEDYMAEHPIDSGLNPVTKTSDMTQPVGIDENGQLWTAPTSGESGGETEEEPEDILLGTLPMTIGENNCYLLSETNATISTGEGAAQLLDFDVTEPYIGETTYNGGVFEKIGKNTIKVGFANVARNASVFFQPNWESGKTYTIVGKLIDRSSDIADNKIPYIRINHAGNFVQLNLKTDGTLSFKTLTADDTTTSAFIGMPTVSGTYVAGETYATVAIYIYEGEHTEIPSGATFDILAGEKYNTDGYIGSTLSAVNGETVSVYQTNTSGAESETDNGGVIFFGDSILHYSDVVSRYAAKTGKSVVNCAVGGTRMSASRDSTNAYYSVDMANIANAIASDDFSAQLNSGVATAGFTTLASVNIANYKAMVLEFGTNDFSAKVPFDGEDVTSIKGAMKHILTSILTKYPNMRIVVLSTLQYITLGTGNESGVPTHDDGTVWQMNEVIKGVCESDEFCVPFVDMYHAFGQNAITRNTLNSDGVHLTSPNGAKRYADILIGKLNALGI